MENETNYIKSGKKKHIIIASVIGIILCLVIAAAVIILNNPKIKVSRALKATNNYIMEKKSFEENATGEDDIVKYLGDGYNQSIEVSVKSSDDAVFQEYVGSGLKFNELRDEKNKKQSDYLSVKYKGTDLGDLSFYTDNSTAMFKVPAIYDSWIKFDCENIQKQYNNSLLGQYKRMPNDEVSLKLFDDEELQLMNEKVLLKKIIEEYAKSHKDELNTLNKNIKVEKMDEVKTINVGGKDQQCKPYSVSISKEDINKLLASACDYIKNDKQSKIALKNYVKSINTLSDLDKNLEGDALTKVADNYEKSVEKIKKDFSMDDMKMTVYIDKKGQAVEVDIDTALNIKHKNYPVKLSTVYKGNDNIADDMDISASISNGIEDISIDMNCKQESEGTSIKDTAEGKVSLGGKIININVNSEYDTSSCELKGYILVKEDNEELGVNYTGTYNYDRDSKSFGINMSEINVKATSNNQTSNLVCDFVYNRAPLTETIDEPSENKIEIFKASQYQLVSMIYEIESKMNSLEQSLQL